MAWRGAKRGASLGGFAGASHRVGSSQKSRARKIDQPRPTAGWNRGDLRSSPAESGEPAPDNPSIAD